MSVLGKDYIHAKLHTAGGDASKDWYVYYFFRSPDTGKMQMFKVRKGINRIKKPRTREVEGNALRDVVNQLLRDGWSPFKRREPKPALIQSLEKELDFMRARCETGAMRKRSYDSYRSTVQLLISWMKKNNMELLQPQQFTTKNAHGFCEYMIREKKYKGVTFNGRKSYVSVFFNRFVDREIITSNPFRKVKPLPETPVRNTPFTKKQMAEIDKHMIKNCYQLWVFTRFIYYCFLRPMEITLINISDINTKKWYITIYGDKAKTKTQGVVWVPKKLQEIIQGMNLNKHSPKDYLFSRGLLPGPVPISRNRVTDLFQKLVKIPLGLPEEQTMYAFKHTGNVRAVELKIGMEAQRIQNRHSTQAQTMVYLRSIGQVPNKEFMDKMK